MAARLITSQTKTLAEVLLSDRFSIPWYQRPYAWKTEHVECLLEDIKHCASHNRPHHFLGTIMTVSNRGKALEINDGQQRITTFLLICACLCKSFEEHRDAAGERQTLRLMFHLVERHTKTLSGADTLQPRVKLATNDNATFESLIRGHSTRQDGLLSSAWKTIDKFFATPEYRSSDKKKRFLDFLLKRTLVTWTQFAESSDAIAVFETANTRGKPLEPIQIACIYFYSCLQEDATRSMQAHEQIEHIRTVIGKREEDFFDYARCFAQCRYGHLSKERFRRDLEEAIGKTGKRDIDEVSEFIDRMALPENIDIFRKLQKVKAGNDDLWKTLDKLAGRRAGQRPFVEYLRDLHQYRKMSNPIMFALLCRFMETPETARIAMAGFVRLAGKLLASFFQRAAHSSASSFSPSKYECEVAALAKDIAEGKCKTAKAFMTALVKMDKQNITSDAHYRELIEALSFPSKAKRAKYVLGRINEHIQQDDTKVVDGRATLDHILPKDPQLAFKWGFDEDNHPRCVNRLGNLTLFAPEDGKPVEKHNANFVAKKKVLKKSVYALNHEVAEAGKWDDPAIKKRQKRLASLAARVWDFKTEG